VLLGDEVNQKNARKKDGKLRFQLESIDKV
jgi:hypothetical protein